MRKVEETSQSKLLPHVKHTCGVRYLWSFNGSLRWLLLIDSLNKETQRWESTHQEINAPETPLCRLWATWRYSPLYLDWLHTCMACNIPTIIQSEPWMQEDNTRACTCIKGNSTNANKPICLTRDAHKQVYYTYSQHFTLCTYHDKWLVCP